MSLTLEQRQIAATIDARVQTLVRAGSSDLTILAAMADSMPDFKRLMDVSGQEGMNELAGQYAGLFHYAKILERLALGLESGEIRVPQ